MSRKSTPAASWPASTGAMEPAGVETDVEAKDEEITLSEGVWTPTKNEWLIMISLAFIALMVALDATILVTVLPEIARNLNETSVEAFWAVIASISQVFGRQQLLLTSLVFFTVGTIFCSTSKDFTMMLTSRCIQGSDPNNFPMVLGAWSVGSIIVPVVGGALTENASWRWCFHINYPFCGIGFVIAAVLVRLNAVEKLNFAQKLKRTDWTGIVLFVGGMTSFLVGLSWGGIQYPWKSAATLAPIIVGLFGIVVFGCWQQYAMPHSLLPMSVFYNWSAIAAFYCALVNGLLLCTGLYYIPFYLMSVRAFSSTDAGKGMLPAVCLLIPGSITVSILTSRLGRFRWAIWGGWAVTTLACGLTILFGLNTPWPVFYTVLAIFGVGTGMVLTSVNVGIQAISKPEDCAMAASMYGFFLSLCMPLGVALAGTIFQNAMSGHLSTFGLQKSIAHDSERWVYILRTMEASPKKTAILESYVKSFESVFVVMAGIAASALVASFVIRKFSMDKILLAQFTAR
ncbi:MFS general substrate transporter [Setomelanomma holmii]|uniref:MFS general substrate transporter n=1 Tax=Setomelanomma holmii TaxID=210430 RepID=A0A9P4HK97_9PLEO|nr:MFS general substrate transporter [Setomelanomma holmii]